MFEDEEVGVGAEADGALAGGEAVQLGGAAGAVFGHEGDGQAAFFEQGEHEGREALQAGEAGGAGEDVGRGFAVERPGGVVGADMADLAGFEGGPHALDLGGGAEGRVALAAAAEAGEVVFGHAEVLDAGLAGGGHAHGAEGGGEFETAGEGGVGDVDVGAGLQADFEDFEVGEGFGERGPGAGVPDGAGMAGAAGIGGEAFDEFLVFVVDGDGEAGAGDEGEGVDHGGVVDAGEAGGVVFVGAELEGGNAAGGEFGDGVEAAGFADGAVEGDVDMGGAVHPADLFLEQGGRGDGVGDVVGHVDAGGDSAGGGAAGAALDAGEADAAAGVHVPVDEAGEDEAAGMVGDVGGGRGFAFADGGDGFAADGDVGAGEDGAGCDDVPEDDAVEGVGHGGLPLREWGAGCGWGGATL